MKLLHIVLICCALVGTPAFPQSSQNAQVPPIPSNQPNTAAAVSDAINAYQTREIFKQLLRQYPPFIGQVLRLDPSLMTNETFLAPYSNLAAFLKQHPEIPRNPSFYIGEPYGNGWQNNLQDTPEGRSYEMFQALMIGIATFTAVLIALGGIGWVLKTVIVHRRWLRVSKIQSEVHSKLLDRFTSNQDLLSYIQTPAGRHFLESAPISVDPGSRPLTAPLGRILVSVQAGIVLALAGLGLHIVSQTLASQEIAQPLFVLGVLAAALGIGFVLSALIAYILSRRLGLLDRGPLTSTTDTPGAAPPDA